MLSRTVWRLALVLVAVSAVATSAPAQTFWTPSAGGIWSLPANWDAGVPNATSAWARFGYGGTGAQTVTVNGAFTVGRLTFASGNGGVSTYAWTLDGGALTLNNGATAALIERVNGDANQVINTPLAVGGNGQLTVNNGGITATGVSLGSITLASVSGTGSRLTINAAGTSVPGLVVIQSGTYGGTGSTTTITAGTLQANQGTGLPTNTALVINGGTTATLWEVTQNTTVTRVIGTNLGDIRVTGTVAGFSTLAGTMALNFGGSGGTVQWGQTNFNPVILQFGRGVSGVTDNYVLQNGLDLNGAPRTVRIAPRATATFAGNVVNTSANTSGLNVGSGSTGGTLVLTGTNTYNGTTTVAGHILRANESNLSSNSNLVLNGGTLEGNGTATFSRSLGTGAGQVRLIGGGTNGFSAFGGTHTIRLNGGTGTVQWGSTDFNPGTLHLNGWVTGVSNANALVDFQNGLDLNVAAGAARFIQTRDNPNSTADIARISGVISNSAGGGALVVGGTGTTEFTAANTYTGQTVLTDSAALPGTILRLAGSGSVANSSLLEIGTARTLDVTGLTGGANYSATHGRFAVASGQTLQGIGAVTGDILIGTGATIRGGTTLPQTPPPTPTGQLTVAGGVRLGGGALAIDLNGASATGATVSRVAVTGAGNAFDIATANGPAVLRLVNDGSLTANQSYTFTVASSAGGFTRNGTSVSSYTFGSDFTLSGGFTSFTGVSLTVSGSNLVLTFTPVPEPATVGLLAVAGLGVAGVIRRRKRATV